jgi:uncharacterized protein YhbP (UPF0306 family)
MTRKDAIATLCEVADEFCKSGKMNLESAAYVFQATKVAQTIVTDEEHIQMAERNPNLGKADIQESELKEIKKEEKSAKK